MFFVSHKETPQMLEDFFIRDKNWQELKFGDEEPFAYSKDMWVLTNDFFKDKSLHVTDIVSWSQVEVCSRCFSVDVSLDIIPVLAEAILEALHTFANIFIFWMVYLSYIILFCNRDRES